MRKIAPSILSADFSKLGSEVAEVEALGAHWIHVDVMDGHFVPNLTIGPVVVRGLRAATRLDLDVHLMVTHPEKWIEPFAQAGAQWITFHIEAASDPLALIKDIRRVGAKVGISLNPDTPVVQIVPYLGDIDLVLLMSVHPGFAGQGFISEVLKKMTVLQSHPRRGKFLVEIDGGIQSKTIKQAEAAGVDIFVAGNAVFGQKDRQQAMRELQK